MISETPLFRNLVHALPPDWPIDEYVLVGSAVLAVRGIRDCGDLDVLVSRKLWPDAKKRRWPSADRVSEQVRSSLQAQYFDVRDNTQKPISTDAYLGEELHRTPLIDFMNAVPRLHDRVRFEDVLEQSAVFEVPAGVRTGIFFGAYRSPPARKVRVMSIRHCIAVKSLVPSQYAAKHRSDIRALTQHPDFLTSP